MDTVGIVGLGVMGSNCAKKLMESGVPVAGYDPYPPAVKRASEAGVAVCGSPAELAGKARVILMFVPGPADTEKVVLGEGGIASGAPEGTVVVNMSTVDPGVNIRMGEALAPKGIDFVDAPVMGSPSGVGSWAFALGGSDEALAKIKDVLLVLSGSEEKLFHIGPLGHITTIIVSQRASSIKNSDKIVVLDDGKLAGIGTHEELLENSEVYKEICLSQLTREEAYN